MLTLNAVTSAQVGNYRVIVSNAAGSTLSDMVVLHVVPPPSILNAGLMNTTNVSFSFISTTNQSYAVEYKDTLTQPAWLTLRIVNGDGGTLTITDSMTNLPSRFYRIRVP